MKGPPHPSAEHMIQDYLGRVSDAARVLPKGDRLLFVVGTRAQIERRCGPAETADPDDVRQALADLGEPEAIVRRERARIDAAPRGSAGPSTGPPPDLADKPLPRRPVTARRRPGTQPLPTFQATSRAGAALPEDRSPRDGGAADGRSGGGERPPAPGLVPLVRAHPLEVAAVALLGAGGAVLPLPFWPAGAVLVLVSRFFGVRDTWVALIGPLLFVLAGSAAIAAVGGGHGNPLEVYTHVVAASAGYLVRVGDMLAGGYLAWRVQRGPSSRVPPWKR